MEPNDDEGGILARRIFLLSMAGVCGVILAMTISWTSL